jgi:hypothetical protein
LVNLLSCHFQAAATYNGGQGWDGVHYYRTAEQFAGGETIRGDAPFCFRIGTPFLVSLLRKTDLILGFKTVNLAANVLTFVLFVIWTRLFISGWGIRCLLVVLFLTQWLGPFRNVYFAPVNTDPALYCIILLGLLCIHFARSRPLLAVTCLSVVVFFGVAFREVAFLLAIAMLFAQNPIIFSGLSSEVTVSRFKDLVRMPPVFCWLPVLSGLAGFVWLHQMAHQVNDYSFLREALKWAYEKSWLSYLHSLFIAYGPVIVLVIFNWRRSLAFLVSHQALLVFMAGFCVLAYLGGSDTERFWFWTMPVTYVLIGKAIEENRLLLQSKALIVLLFATQAIAQRVFWTCPDYPNGFRTPLPILTVPGNRFQLLDLFSCHGKRSIEAVSLAEYAFLAVVIIWWLSCRAKRIAKGSHA